MEKATPLVKQLNNYNMIDLMKYLAAVMVICVHCSIMLPQSAMNYLLTNIICRIAVPFFFISSAYFVRRGIQTKPKYLSTYLKKLGKSYLFWSLIFIPVGWDWVNQNLQLDHRLLPFALIFGLIYVGTYYHLWYIPAMIVSLFFADKLLKYFSYKVLLLISGVLYLFGSLETYYGLLPAGGLKAAVDLFIQLFFTTRSGLLFGLIFVTIGFFIFDYQEKITPHLEKMSRLTVLFGVLLVVEGILLHDVQRMDMNFLLLLVPFSFCFFCWIASFSWVPTIDTRKIRDLSKFYYFIHPIVIVIVEEIGKAFGLRCLMSGFCSFLLIVLMTHLWAVQLTRLTEPVTLQGVPTAVFLGVIATLIIGAGVFQLGSSTTALKFELIPSIWLYATFMLYFFMISYRNKPDNYYFRNILSILRRRKEKEPKTDAK